MKLMVGVARFLLLCAVVLVIPALAAAQVSVTLQPNQGPVNTGVTATGTGWPAGTAVYIYFESQLIGGPVTPDTGGAFTTTFCVPDRQPGVYPVFFTNGRENFAPPFTITAGGPGNCQITALPDLIPTAIQYNSADLVPGGTVTFDSGIQNAGAQGTGVFNIKWFVDGVEVGYGSHGGVPANITVLDGNSAYRWPATAGTYRIEFRIDVDNHVAESNEANNSTSVTVTVASAPAQIWDTPGGRAPNLIVLVHGCCTDANKVIEDWDSFGMLIGKTIQTPGAWEIVVWDWSTAAKTPGKAYKNAYDQGIKLATAIVHYSYRYLHLIAHSAGARLIDTTAKGLVNYYKTINVEERPFIQLTFLDAYQPNDDNYGFLENYPNHYSEHYVDRTGSVIAGLTNSCLRDAFNFDITDWEHSPEEDGRWGHHWPINWYKKSVTSISPKFKYGYTLSLEGSGKNINELVNELAKYRAGEQCAIFNEYADCVPAPCW